MSQYDNRTRQNTTRSRSSQGNSDRNNVRSGRRPTQTNRTQTNRSSAYRQSGRYPRRKRKPPFDIVKIAIAVLAVILAVVVIGVLVRAAAGRKKGGDVQTSAEVTTVAPTELQREVTVDGITITGMSKEEAGKTLTDRYSWGLKIVYGEQEYEVKNLLEAKIDALLDNIYSGTMQTAYTLDLSDLEDAVRAEADAAAAQWDVPAKNGSVSGFDKEKKSFIYSGEQTGKIINREKLTSDLMAQINSKNFSAKVQAEADSVAPKITEAQAKELYQVLGTYTTTTTANPDRNTNIRLATECLEGLILQPGEEFSFNKATGERSMDKGYRPAGAYSNGVLVEEPGGGVCQVSSTLYNAVVFAGLDMVERHAHSYEPSYVTPGEDAMVSFGGPDMRFVNNSPSAIALRASFEDRKLKISVVGIRILDKGVELSMSSKKTAELDPPAPVYEEDQTLEPGVEKVVVEAKKGSRWVTNLVTKKDGAVVSDEFFHNSTYRGKPATIKRNTSGVVVPAQTSSAAEESTTPPADTDAAAQPTTGNGGSQTEPTTGQGQETTTAGPGDLPQTTEAPAALEEPAGPGEGGGQSGTPEPPTVIAPNPLG